MSDSPRYWVVIPAAGIGARMQADRPKQYLSVLGKTIIQHTLTRFLDMPQIEGIYVGISATDHFWHELPVANETRIASYIGGEERFQTVLLGLEAMSERCDEQDWVLVHDAARPCIDSATIEQLIGRLDGHEVGGLLAHPVAETLKLADDEDHVATTVDRTGLWAAQTPQMFRYGLLVQALRQAVQANIHVTDESSALESLGYSPLLIEAPASNIKVTRNSDLLLVEKMMGDSKPRIRIGTGYDVHAFEAGDHITLGGVKITHDQGLKAHSDGDVLLHAISDALLGALSLGDIGHHFPDTDEQWRGADSRSLLRAVYALVKKEGYGIINIDATIIAQTPKMAPYISNMINNIAEDLEVAPGQVACKATTTEKLGFTGRKEGIAVNASCLVEKL